MGFMDFLKRNDINSEIANLEEGAVLLDVREPDEFGAGHIPGAVNAPLSALSQFHLPRDKNTPIRVYCLVGSRSRRAVIFLQSQGFTNVKNIGGINFYKGRIEKND